MVLFNILMGIVLVSCICTNVLILAQKKRSALSSTITGMGGGEASYADKNKGRTREGQLERYTKILGAVFMVVSLALNIVR